MMRSISTLLRTWVVTVACCTGLFLAACGGGDYRPNAIGPEGEITVVVDSSLWTDDVGTALREQVGAPINTLPQPEPSFDLRQYSLNSQEVFDYVRRRRNVIIAAPLSDSTSEAATIRGSMSDDAVEAVQSGQSVVASRPDLWRRDQQVFLIAASTPEHLAETIRNRGEALRDSFNVLARQRLYEDMFDRGRQVDIEEEIMQKHGFAINVQHDYRLAIDTTTENTGFVSLARLLPDTWRRVFVWYQEGGDPADLSPAWIYAKRDSLARQYLQGNVGGYAKLDQRAVGGRDYLDTEEVNFLGRYGFETRGLWFMAGETESGEEVMFGGGGPFLNYTFYDQETDRIYMLDGMVFAPDFDKREFLRQMEVIAHTFRTRAEAEAGANPQVASRAE